MIFVTVGSISFDDLIRRVDDAVARGEIEGEVLLQIANGSYEPVHCEFFRTAPGLDPYYERASLVVGHGGTGTTLEVIERGLRLISVSNPNMIDNHQHEFLEALDRRGFTRYCRAIDDLPAMIRRYLADPKPAPVDTSLFFRSVVDDLDALPAAG